LLLKENDIMACRTTLVSIWRSMHLKMDLGRHLALKRGSKSYPAEPLPLALQLRRSSFIRRMLFMTATMKSDDSVSFLNGDTYCSEEYFQRMLTLERKRSKRSGRPFMLILLDIGKLLKGKREEKQIVLNRLVSALDSSTSEIDVKGWYVRDSIIGVICQDVNKEDRDSVSGKLSDELDKGRWFTKKEDSIKMFRLFFPDAA
jgi:hypothetical protein